MSARWCLLGALTLLLLPLQSAAQEPSAQPKFRSTVDVVSVTAVVRDKKGRFVRNLQRKDFVVAEEGVPRPILDFRAQIDGPVKVAVLFDVSGSMRLGSKAEDAKHAARAIFGALKGGDEAAIYVFDKRLHEVAGFTSDLGALESALVRVDQPFGQTSLYDAVAQTARGLGVGRPGLTPQRSAIVVLTDGIDTSSQLTVPQVSAVASGIDVPVYVVAVMAPIDVPRQSDGQIRKGPAGELHTLSQWTGGELFTAIAPLDAGVAARQIVDELRHQYLLAFEATQTRSGWRPLEVRARDRGLTVRARAGYTAGGQTGDGEMASFTSGDKTGQR